MINQEAIKLALEEQSNKFRVIPTNDIDFEVLEFKPHVRSLVTNGIYKKVLIPIQLPYVQYARYTGVPNGQRSIVTGLYMTFTNEPINSLNDDVYIPPLQGCGYYGPLVCLAYNRLPRAASLARLISYFWDSYGYITASSPLDILSWRKKNEKDILLTNWRKTNHKLANIPREFIKTGVPH